MAGHSLELLQFSIRWCSYIDHGTLRNPSISGNEEVPRIFCYLLSQWSDGRPVAWDESYEWLLVETMRHDLRWYGLEQWVWTCSLLAVTWPSRRESA